MAKLAAKLAAKLCRWFGVVWLFGVVGMKEKKSGVIGPKKNDDDDGRDPPSDHAARGW